MNDRTLGMEIPLLHTKQQAAFLLGVSLRTIDNLIAGKELLSRKIGRRVLIPYTALLAFTRLDHPTVKLAA